MSLRALLLLQLMWLPLHDFALGRGWPTVRAALETFQQQSMGSPTSIPYSFTVPATDSWPATTHGLRLGQIVSRIKNRGDYAAHAAELQGLGLFPRDVAAEAAEDADFDKFLQAMWAWAQHDAPHATNATSALPRVKYRIPNAAPYPASLHGYPLGSSVEQLRRGLKFSSTEHRAHLKVNRPRPIKIKHLPRLIPLALFVTPPFSAHRTTCPPWCSRHSRPAYNAPPLPLPPPLPPPPPFSAPASRPSSC